MKQTIMLSILGLLAMLLIAGCPRDTGDGTETGGNAASQAGTRMETPGEVATDTATDPAGEMTAEDPNAEATAAEVVDEGAAVDGAMDDGSAVADEAATDGEKKDAEPATDEASPQISYVVLETTKGEIVLEIHHDWAPLGAAHFIELVKDGFYDGAPWFRVIEGFVAQSGIAADPAVNTKWMNKTIMDEPVLKGNKPGYVAFGTSGPNSRSTHFFINYGDNSANLDGQGFSCFAQVSKGMDIALQLHKCVFENQTALAQTGGLAMFKTQNPDADYITRAYVK